MLVGNDLDHSKNLWRRMTPKEKVGFWLVTIVIVLLFALVIAGGIVLGITGKPWLLIGAVVGFIGFGLSFPILGTIKRRSVFRAIRKSKKAVEGRATVTSVWIGWHAYKENKVRALTLNIRCEIDGTESRGWYRLDEEELKKLETEWVTDASIDAFGNSHPHYRREVTQESIDKIINIGNEIAVRYVPGKPKYCVVLGKDRP